MPLKQSGWKGDLDPFLEKISAVATGSGSLTILNVHARLALGLPMDRAAAFAVVGLYHPQRWRGRILKNFAQLLVAANSSLGLQVFRSNTHRHPEVSWLREAAEAGTIGFLGCNPAHGPRCILGGILPGTGGKFVAKLGFSESSEAIRREAAFLKAVKGRFPGIIAPMDFDEGIDWKLLRLPYLGEKGPGGMLDMKVANLLNAWLGTDQITISELPWAMRLLDKVPPSAVAPGWHHRIGSHRVRRALMHGDFAVWNLRIVDDGICALDWEWADEHGMAGIDLAHGLRQECYMVKGMSPGETVKSILAQAETPPWKEYLGNSGWGEHLSDWLSLGLLHSHFNALNDSTKLLEILGIRLKNN